MAKTVEELRAKREEIGKRIDALVADRIEATLSGSNFNANSELEGLKVDYIAIGEALPIAAARQSTKSCCSFDTLQTEYC
jgi:hypothetical protein